MSGSRLGGGPDALWARQRGVTLLVAELVLGMWNSTRKPAACSRVSSCGPARAVAEQVPDQPLRPHGYW